MLTVHHLETSRSQRVLWLLEELGVPYDLRCTGATRAPSWHPASARPCTRWANRPSSPTDGDVIAESGAIIEYLVERFAQHAHRPIWRIWCPSPARPSTASAASGCTTPKAR
jgi:glutathione S-transferase